MRRGVFSSICWRRTSVGKVLGAGLDVIALISLLFHGARVSVDTPSGNAFDAFLPVSANELARPDTSNNATSLCRLAADQARCSASSLRFRQFALLGQLDQVPVWRRSAQNGPRSSGPAVQAVSEAARLSSARSVSISALANCSRTAGSFSYGTGVRILRAADREARRSRYLFLQRPA
jgi:hypothetical protein